MLLSIQLNHIGKLRFCVAPHSVVLLIYKHTFSNNKQYLVLLLITQVATLLCAHLSVVRYNVSVIPTTHLHLYITKMLSVVHRVVSNAKFVIVVFFKARYEFRNSCS